LSTPKKAESSKTKVIKNEEDNEEIKKNKRDRQKSVNSSHSSNGRFK
jgi:hypothetical protein